MGFRVGVVGFRRFLFMVFSVFFGKIFKIILVVREGFILNLYNAIIYGRRERLVVYIL